MVDAPKTPEDLYPNDLDKQRDIFTFRRNLLASVIQGLCANPEIIHSGSSTETITDNVITVAFMIVHKVDAKFMGPVDG